MHFSCRTFRGYGVSRVLYIISCAAPPARNVARLVNLAQDEGWDVCLRSEEHTSELQSQSNIVCRLLLEKKKNNNQNFTVLHLKSPCKSFITIYKQNEANNAQHYLLTFTEVRLIYTTQSSLDVSYSHTAC